MSKNFYQQVPDDDAMWGPLLEKMMAKFYGNYETLDGAIGPDNGTTPRDNAYGSDAIETMQGSPYKEYLHSDIKNDSTKKL